MSGFERWLFHLSNLAVVATGLIYTAMLYAMESDDPFSIVNHPLQPQVQHLHVLLAPLFVFAVGLIWRQHIWNHWSRGVRQARRTGTSLLLLLLPMVASGYFLQVAVEPQWRTAWGWVHLVSSGLWVLAFIGHFSASFRRSRGAKKSRSLDQAPAGAPSRG